jgi:hypothetical protein
MEAELLDSDGLMEGATTNPRFWRNPLEIVKEDLENEKKNEDK